MEIIIDSLSKSYDGIPVLENFSAQFASGRPVCLMGPSGRGKTTLFSILLGLVKKDSGTVTGTENRRFSAVFQEDRLCEELSALMNLAIVLDSPDMAQLAAFLCDMGLEEEEIRRPVSSLSGGQRRRVAILRSLVSHSDAVLMDEPFKGLDEDTRLLVIQQVKRHLGGRLLVVITHDEDEAALLGADVLNM